MANGIVVEMSAQEASLLRTLNRLSMSQDELVKKLKDMERGYNEAGAAGERSSNRVERATSATAKAKWEEERAIRKTKQAWEEQAQSAEKSSSAASDAVRNVAAMASAYVSVQAAIAQVNRELERKRELQREAADTQITLEAAHAEISRNVPAAQIGRMLAASGSIARERSVPEQYVARGLAQAYSASGGNADAATSAVSMAAGFLKSDPSAIARYAGSLVDVAAVTGTTDAAVNQGLVAGVGAMSRVVDPAQQARNIPAALVGMQVQGATSAQAGAFFAAISGAIKDAEGAVSRTAGIQLAKQLAEFLPAGGLPEQVTGGLSEADTLSRAANQKALAKARAKQAAGGRLSESDIAAIRAEEGYARRESERKVIGARPGLADFGSRLEYLQQNPAMAAAFLRDASFETQAIGPIQKLLTNPSSELARLYTGNLAQFPSIDEMRKTGQGTLTALQKSPYYGVAEFKRILDSGSEELDKQGAGIGAVAREGLKQLLAKSGQTDLGTKIDSMRFDWNTSMGTANALEYTRDEIRRRQAELQSPTERRVFGPGGAPSGAKFVGPVGGMQSGSYYDVPRTPTAEEAGRGESLQAVANKLDELIRVTKAGQEKARPPALANPDIDK